MKPELLAPVSDRVMLKAAIDAGADCVYFGLKKLNMRATARNFTLEELPEIVKQCHENNEEPDEDAFPLTAGPEIINIPQGHVKSQA